MTMKTRRPLTGLAWQTSLFGILALAVIACAGCVEKPEPPTAPLDELPITDTVYAEISPRWEGFSGPEDVLVGMEPFVYVADTKNNRVVMLDLAGRIVGSSGTVKRPIALAQDYRFNLLIAAELDTVIQGTQVTLGAIYRIPLAEVDHAIERASVQLLYVEPSRPNRRFTGIGALPDNTYLVARVGPLNTSPVDPDNSVIRIDHSGRLVSPVNGITPSGNAIGSIGGLSSLYIPNNSRNFAITQTDAEQQFRYQAFNFYSGAEGEGWRPSMQPAFEEGALMTVNRFSRPEDIAVDQFGNIYVVDAERDSVYKFNTRGLEFRGQSFGGASVFSNPHGVAHFNRTLYVADTDNNRVVRWRLTTDN